MGNKADYRHFFLFVLQRGGDGRIYIAVFFIHFYICSAHFSKLLHQEARQILLLFRAWEGGAFFV